MQSGRTKIRRDIERYRFLLRNISNPTLITLLNEMIAEAEAELAILDAQWRTTSPYDGPSNAVRAPDAFEPNRPRLVRIGDWRLDPHSKSATSPAGKHVRLTKAEFELLFTFLTHAGQILSREDLMMLSQSRSAAPGERTIDVLINRLRRKLESDPRHPDNISTVRNEGYIFQLHPQDGDRSANG